MANRVALLSVAKVIKDTPLNASVDNDLVASMLFVAQDKYIWPKLGTDLYNKLKSDVVGSTLTGDYQTLVETYIAPALTWYTIYEMLPALRVRLVAHGAQVMNSEQGAAASRGEVQELRGQAKNSAEFYTQRLVDYLCHNQDLFPEYTTNTNDDLHPNRVNYTGGMNLVTNGRRYTEPRFPLAWYIY